MFKIYSSSAGSGKTYTLTREYIRLALHPDNDSYFRHILAVTFTNAAAAEMKDRILGMLRTFAAGINHPMLKDILAEEYPQLQPGTELYQLKMRQLQGRAARIFTRILHDYSDFSVMTIDSFMSRLVNSFTDELGLPHGFETRLDSDLLTEAIERLLAKIGLEGQEPLTRLLENYYLEHAREEGSWGTLPRQMESVAADLLNEQSYLSMTRVSDLTLTDWQQIRQQIVRFVKSQENEIQTAASRAMDLMAGAGLTEKDFYYSGRGIYGYFQHRSQGEKCWEAPNSYVCKTILEGVWAAKKIALSAQNAIDGLSSLLHECYKAIERIRKDHGARVALYKSIVPQLYNLSLLNEIKHEFDLLLRKNNQVHISEFNRRVMDIILRDPVPFIFERLGDKYFHILIDEFQDTSRLQFANLLPLIDNSLANGYFNLIVGDVKQAIYRFRGGDMELLLRLTHQQAEILHQLYEPHGAFLSDRLFQVRSQTLLSRLVVNRRSYREITGFNNDFFGFLSRSQEETSPLLKSVYDEHFRQETGEHTPTGGHVEIEFFEEDAAQETPDAPDAQGNRTIGLVGALCSEGYAWRDIAILCRYKKDAAQLARWLEQEGIPLVSDDSLLLSNSSHIALLIAFIRVIYAPTHRNYRLEAALQFLHVVLKKNPEGSDLEQIVLMSKEPDLDSFLRYFADHGYVFEAGELESLGIYELCEQLIAGFHLNKDKNETRYLFRFLDEVLKFETTRVNHLGDFLTWWEKTASGLSIAAPLDTDAVRITTIHKSKGLEYPVVIIPYADWKATPKPGSRLWIDLGEVEFEELNAQGRRLLSAGVSFTKSLLETPVQKQYEDEVERVLVENINLTYVAFTRPVQRMYILAAQPVATKDGKMASAVNAWLQAYLIEKGLFEPGVSRYILHEGTAGPFKEQAGKTSVFALTSTSGNRKAARLSLKKNAEQLFDTENFERKNDLNQKLRQIIRQLGTASDLHQVIQKNLFTGLIRPDEGEQIRLKLERLMNLDGFAEAFSPGSRKLAGELILAGGDTLEADRLVQTEKGEFVLLLTDPSEMADKRLKKLIRCGQAAGLKPLKGRLINLENEEITEISG